MAVRDVRVVSDILIDDKVDARFVQGESREKRQTGGAILRASVV